ncbi:MAG: hypothetical protein AB4372_06485 [Xenococcus sp. (in: cyanobacteria)]
MMVSYEIANQLSLLTTSNYNNMVMTNFDKQSDNLIVFTSKEKLFLDSKHDILLLLQHLAESQETTVKLILGRLYDVGADNLIKQKIPSLPLKKVLKGASRLSKSAFIVIAFYWFKKNCPQLITDWLLDQVSFTNSEDSDQELVTVEPISVEAEQLKIKQLRSQVQVLKRTVIGLIWILGGSITWIVYNTNHSPLSSLATDMLTIIQQR